MKKQTSLIVILIIFIAIVVASSYLFVHPSKDSLSTIQSDENCVKKGELIASSLGELKTIDKKCCPNLEVLESSNKLIDREMFSPMENKTIIKKMCRIIPLRDDDPASFICFTAVDGKCEEPENNCNNPNDCYGKE